MRAIYKREFRSYFQSMIGYAFIAFLMLFTGIYFTAYNLTSGYPYFAAALASSMLIFLIAVPVLTMKSFAEERKSKTDQLLLTSPVSVTGIVLGKYMAMVSVFAIPCLLFGIYPLMIKAQGNAYLKTDYMAILMFFIIGCVYIAIGMFLSALTESQIIAAVSTFAVLLIFYFWSGIINFLPTKGLYNLIGVIVIVAVVAFLVFRMTKNWMIGAILGSVGAVASIIVYVWKETKFDSLLSNVLAKLDFGGSFGNIYNTNLFDVSNVVLCGSLIFLFVFLTVQVIQRRRWS